MPKLVTAAKRFLLGRPFRSDRISRTLLPKRIALPVFSSDPMSSVAYAPEEILLMLSVAGLSAYAFTPWVGLAVVIVMTAVIASSRQNIYAYPSGGGDYRVTAVNHGRRWGLVVASALMVDYILTVAVSISAAAANIGSAVPFVAENKVAFAVVAIVVLAALNLRGIRETGILFAIPSYAFVVGMLSMVAFGFYRVFIRGEEIPAESAGFDLAEPAEPLSAIAMLLIVLRAFSSGSAALTGVEAISNGVPAFRKPKAHNAARTLVAMGVLSVSMFAGLLMLAQLTGVKVAENPDTQLLGAPEGYQQRTMVAQIADAVFDGVPLAFYFLLAVTGLILAIAANTAFNGFPVLGSILAQDRYLPRQLHTRGDRLAYSNGIIFLAAAAILLVIAFGAEVTDLIHLYIVGVFVAFVLSQSGMLMHWRNLLRTEKDPVVRRRMRRAQVVNMVGLVTTAIVLVVVVVTKFFRGAWIAIAAMAVLYLLMTGIRRHYDRVATELAEHEGDTVLPSRNHAIVLVSQLHRPTLRALAYARATRPDVLEAVTVNVDEANTLVVTRRWQEENFQVPLKVIESPYREITKPVLDYVTRIRTDNPRNVVTVFIPEYVVGHWWENLLHNQSALRLKGRLLFEPGVMVTSVPWQLASSQRVAGRAGSAPGRARRGLDISEAEHDRRERG
ncbi:APC family permease [Actinoalloteichus hymeniacidonis]|uniref:Amino acid/polyamine/organocation transporter, APC superfamily n=1 Tax=Actinoalloteichus hymeniacidonis TaxID=340345 RepID=A0AAC9MWR8_9PSEU|nr:APC family permease [Actinoalloteichus hymeniacidonis]AOS62503.1 amino acid/polyamine/organocation transporter, APC superfamily [Actinoalloteichus hymeniacidonis]MBB5909466.1 amino acid transporter [Actinoalloteichus hymeniacidonis]